jgi:hypothetical protein
LLGVHPGNTGPLLLAALVEHAGVERDQVDAFTARALDQQRRLLLVAQTDLADLAIYVDRPTWFFPREP